MGLTRRAFSVCLLTVGCAELYPQQYAGVNHTEIVFSQTGDVVSINSRDGKELGGAVVVVEQSNGAKLTFNFNDVKAFQGQEIRAEVEKVLAENGINASPELVTAVVRAVLD